MLKKIFTIFSICLCSLFLTGCINMKVADEYTLNDDLSMDHTFQILVSNNMYGFADKINSVLYENFSESGFSNIVNTHDNDYFGQKGTRHLYAGSGLSGDISNKYIRVVDNSADYFIFKHIDINAYIDFSNMLNDIDNSELITITEYKLTLNLPVAFTNSNAHNVYNDGKSATWRFLPSSGAATVHFECNIPNKDNIKFLLICVAGIFGFIIFIKILSVVYSINNSSSNKKCPNCGAKIKNNRTFCNNCGHQLYHETKVSEEINNNQKCPNCGTELNNDDEFCGNCGTKVTEQPENEELQTNENIETKATVQSNNSDNNVKKCPNCFAVLNDDDAFCGQCGHKLNDENAEGNNEVQ